MPELLPYIITAGFSVVVGFGLGYWSHVLNARREIAGRRRVFCGLLRVHIQRIEAANWKKFQGGEQFQMHQDSLIAIADECAKIWSDIPKQSQLRFEAARLAYCGLTKQDVEPYDMRDYPDNAEAILFPRYERGRKRVTDLLREMMGYAK